MAAFVVQAGLRAPGGLQLLGGQAAPAGPWLELLQYLLLVACLSIFAWVALRDRLRRPLALAFVSLFTLFLIRELHEVFDVYVAENFWEVLAGLVTVFAGVYQYRHRQRLVVGWSRSWPSAGLAILLAGLMLLLPFVQILSERELWARSLEVANPRAVARAFEELAELGAYLIILIGSLEFLYAWSRLPQTREMDRPRRRRRGR